MLAVSTRPSQNKWKFEHFEILHMPLYVHLYVHVACFVYVCFVVVKEYLSG